MRGNRLWLGRLNVVWSRGDWVVGYVESVDLISSIHLGVLGVGPEKGKKKEKSEMDYTQVAICYDGIMRSKLRILNMLTL